MIQISGVTFGVHVPYKTAPTLNRLLCQGVRHVVLEPLAAGVGAAATAARVKEAILFNAAAQCMPHLLHPLPSHAMQADAMAQLLAARKWVRSLVLHGTAPRDRLLQAPFSEVPGGSASNQWPKSCSSCQTIGANTTSAMCGC